MKLETDDLKLDRRTLLERAARAALAVPAAAALGALAACGEGGGEPPAEPAPKPAAAPPPEPKAPAAAKPAEPAAEPAAEGGEDRLITEFPSNAVLVTTLKYVDDSPEAERNCGNCQLYTAGEGGRGKCALFQRGVVAEAGWCQSWAKKVV